MLQRWSHSPLPSMLAQSTGQSVWYRYGLAESLSEQLVDGYSQTKKCSDEGRALMSLDVKTLQVARRAHTQGRRHQQNLAKRAARDAAERAPNPAALATARRSALRTARPKSARIGRPGYRVTKQFDRASGRRSRGRTAS